MKIAVVGAGAIGALVAGYLKLQGEDVVLVGRKPSIEKIKDKGVIIKGIRGEFEIKDIKIDFKIPYPVDLVVLCVKTQDIREALHDNLEFIKKAVILTTQNGVEADSIVAEFVDKDRILSSIVMFGSTYINPGEVVHNFEGEWIIGKREYLGKKVDLLEIKDLLGKSFNIVISNNMEGMKWLKLFLNANNCIPAILNMSMQECFSNLDICEVSIGIWQEGYGVIEKAGIKLESLPSFPLERLINLINMPREESKKIFSNIMVNLSKEPLYGSILQSIRRGRASEIDYINGAIVRLGKKVSYHTPLNKKMVELVHKVEEEGKFLSVEEFLFKAKNLLPREKIKEKDYVNTPFPKLKLTVEKVEGDCYHGYNISDEIILEDFTHPPKHFCLGLAHVLFPIIYALSFGAKFPFSPNQRSLSVTCPDGGKLTFKVEILGKDGKVEYIEKDKDYKGPQPKDLVLEVVKSDGKCSYGYKVGDTFEVKGLKCPKDFCGAAYHCAFPALFALNFGAKFFFMDEENSIDTVTCPDGGKIVFKVKRKES